MQLLSDGIFDPEDQSNTQLSLDSSFTSTNNTCITEPIEDGAVVELIQINRTVGDAEKTVRLEVEWADEARVLRLKRGLFRLIKWLRLKG